MTKTNGGTLMQTGLTDLLAYMDVTGSVQKQLTYWNTGFVV